MITVGSLFAGIGGIELGLERTGGFKTVWQVENDPYAIRVLEKHWPDVRRCQDARNFPPRSYEFGYSWRGMPKGTFAPDVKRETTRDEWWVDLICGGDPCQANSVAAGSPTRSKSLGSEFIRIVDVLRPRIVLRENPTIVRKDAPWPWWRMRAAFESLGYVVLPFRLRACCLGGQHRRDRLFLLGELADPMCQRLEGGNGETSPKVESKTIPPSLGPADWPDIPASEGHRSRAGIPNYVDEVRCLGNAVPPQMSEFIGRIILESIA